MEEEKVSTEKSPGFYAEFLRSAAIHQGSKSFNLVDIVSRKIHRESSPTTHLKEVLSELRIQCACQSIRY